MAEYKLSAAVREAGADLRGLREARGMSTRALAEAAGISSHSRVAEAERGVRRLSDDEYLRWMDALDLSAEDRERILTKIRSAESPGHLAVGPPGIGAQLVTLVDHEQIARRITNVGSLLIPGMLQTSDYARAILGDNSETRVALRSGRRDILTRSRNPVEYFAIIDSEVLVRPIGAPDVMLDQMRHLLRMAELPNVTIQVVSSTRRGYNPMLAGPFELIQFEKAKPIVHLEHHRASVTVWDEEDVRAFIEAAEILREEVAMSPEASVELIAGIVKGKETT
jgi:transcriptional regulator with XRE-family HTH domain